MGLKLINYFIMKRKVNIYSLLLSIAILTDIGCVKDEGFENNQYGIKDPGSKSGVLFQQSKVDAAGNQIPNLNGIFFVNTSQAVQTLVKIAAAEAVSSDLRIGITVNNSLLDGSGLTTLDPANFQVPSEVVIPAGEKYTYLVVTIPDATVLDLSLKYGVGFTISSVSDNEFAVASNLKDVVVGIVIKNKYDAEYDFVGGYFYHPSAPRAQPNSSSGETKLLQTFSPTAVTCPLGDLGSIGYYVLLDVDPVTNKVTITPDPGHPTTPPIEQFDDALPTVNPGYTPQWERSGECSNIYDPATKTYYLRYAYVGSTGYRVTEEILVSK